MEQLLKNPVDDEPNGFPRIARIIDSSKDLWVFRRFGYLRVRLIQYYQSRISEFEQKLRLLDEEDSKGDEDQKANLRNRRVDDSQDVSQRKALFHALLEHLRIYGVLHCIVTWSAWL